MPSSAHSCPPCSFPAECSSCWAAKSAISLLIFLRPNDAWIFSLTMSQHWQNEWRWLALLPFLLFSGLIIENTKYGWWIIFFWLRSIIALCQIHYLAVTAGMLHWNGHHLIFPWRAGGTAAGLCFPLGAVGCVLWGSLGSYQPDLCLGRLWQGMMILCIQNGLSFWFLSLVKLTVS